MDVGVVVGELASLDVESADREALTSAVAASARLRAWLDGVDVTVGRVLEQTTGYGAKVFADAANVSLSAGERVVERGLTLARVPSIEAAMREGDVGGAHVDAITRALRQVDETHRATLAARVNAMVGDARSLPANEFERKLKAEVRRLQDDGKPKLEQQKKASRFRSWLSRKTGMWCFAGELDPFSGVLADKRLRDEVERLFRESVPGDAPDDPIERQQWLAASAFLSLLLGQSGAASGKPELIVVVDATNVDDEGRPMVDWDLPVDLPDDVLREVAARARLHVVALWPGGELYLGRSQRLANAAQRRVLRALYPTCAMPGCEARFSKTKAHHVWWWEHGGPTDIDNLLPLCSRCHHRVHDKGWKLKLLPDRTLEVTLPDGTTVETGPPVRAP